MEKNNWRKQIAICIVCLQLRSEHHMRPRLSSYVQGKTCTKTVQGNFGNLLSFATAKQLNLLHVSVKTANGPNLDYPPEEYKCLFGRFGKVKGRLIKLPINRQVKPKRQPHRRIPFHIGYGKTWRKSSKC
jgi:hypothetical protein